MKRLRIVGLLAGASLIVAACGDDRSDPAAATDSVVDGQPDDPLAEAGSGGTPADTPAGDDAAGDEMNGDTPPGDDAAGDEMNGDTPPGDAPAGDDAAGDEMNGDDEPVPTAIISLSPTATEMVYAIGAGDQVLAVDDFSNFPPEAAEKMSGISGWEPNVEAIAGLEPDLVLTDGTNPDFLAQLDTLGIAHWEGAAAASFADVYSQIEQLGAVTGHGTEAADLVARMQADVAAVQAGLPDLSEPLTYYHELDNTFFSVTSDTFIGAVYDEIGLVNIADAVGDGNPYPQLSAEFIIAENPDLIFLACTLYCGETAQTLAARPGWAVLDAVANGGVIEMNDDVASRWGPRIVEYLEAAGDAVTQAAAVGVG